MKVKDIKIYLYRIRQNFNQDLSFINHERLLQIKKCVNNQARQQKIYAWLLINYALSNELFFKIKQNNFSLIEGQIWKYKNFYFSISHKKQYVAIAISKKKIGIDLEIFKKKNFSKLIWQKINFPHNHLKYSPLLCMRTWIKKEAIYKQNSSKRNFFKIDPNQVECNCFNISNTKIWIAATCNLTNLKLIVDI